MHDNTMEKSDIIFNLCTNNYVKQTIEKIHNNNDIINIQSAEVHGIIEDLRKGKAPGQDKIAVIDIKKIPYVGYEILTKI